MKILVTGSAGFIGKQIADRLRAEGHEVEDFDIVTGQNILNLEEVERAVKGKDAVYHIAAQADLTKLKTLEDGKICTDLNVVGTHNLAYACTKYNVWLIYASTCCVYGNAGDGTHEETEDHTLPKPNELYAATKLAAEEVVIGYHKTYDLTFTSLRYATIYGPGMRGALAVAVFLEQAYKGEDITVHGTGDQERTQTFVEDLVDANVRVVSHPEAMNHVINVTTQERVSVNQMAHDIKAITNSPSNIVHVTDRKNQTLFENFSIDKAKNLLGWKPETKWKDGIEKTALWMEKEYGFKKFE